MCSNEVVCLQNIEIGEEFLLDYGEGYNNAFLKPKNVVSSNISNSEVRHELPGYGSDSTSDSDDDNDS